MTTLIDLIDSGKFPVMVTAERRNICDYPVEHWMAFVGEVYQNEGAIIFRYWNQADERWIWSTIYYTPTTFVFMGTVESSKQTFFFDFYAPKFQKKVQLDLPEACRLKNLK